MTPPGPMPDEAARDRAAAAWLTQTQQELLAPAHALRERAAMLTEDVQPHGPAGLYADLLTIQAVGLHLEDLIQDLIPTLTDPDARRDLVQVQRGSLAGQWVSPDDAGVRWSAGRAASQAARLPLASWATSRPGRALAYTRRSCRTRPSTAWPLWRWPTFSGTFVRMVFFRPSATTVVSCGWPLTYTFTPAALAEPS